MATNFKNGATIPKRHIKLKNGNQIKKMGQAKLKNGAPIQKWTKLKNGTSDIKMATNFKNGAS